MVQKWWKSDKKYGSYDILKYPLFLKNISWPVLMNIQQGEMMMSRPHNLYAFQLQKITKNIIFRYDTESLTF